MSLGPMRQGDTAPAALITCQRTTGAIIDLTPFTNGSFALLIQDTATRVERTGAGSFAIQSPATAGVVQYSWAAADTALPGSYNVYVVITTSGGPMTCLALPWTVTPR